MATSYGPWQNRSRVWFDYSVGSVGQSSTHVTVTVKSYVQMDGYASSSGTWAQSWSGYWGSGSQSPNWSLGPNASGLIAQGSYSVALTDSVQSLSFAATGRTFHGASSHSISVSVPARYARTPSGVTVTRISDSSHRIDWTRNSTYTAVVVQRSTNGGAWVQVGRPTGNAATFTDTTTTVNNKYAYRVAGVGGSGQSPWSGTATVFTSPAAPTGVAAARVSNTEIVVTASGVPPHATAFDIEDDGLVIASGVSLPWSHLNPSLSTVHEYRVRGVVGALTGAWSVTSNTVQLLAPPLAPSSLSPNGAVAASDASVRFGWKHNPVDTTKQTEYRLQYRTVGAPAWTTVTGTTAAFRNITLPVGNYEWFVETRGEHPDYSPASAVATVTVITRPGVAIQGSGSWYSPSYKAEWTYTQAQGRPQSAWRVELLDEAGARLELREGSGAATSVALTTLLVDGGSYTVRVQGATGDVWSAWSPLTLDVSFLAPAPALFTGVWNEDSGSVSLSVGEGRGPVIPDIVNYYPNPNFRGDGTWTEMRRNLAVDSSFTTMQKKLGTNTDVMPAGGGASLGIDSRWAAFGATSLKVGEGTAGSSAAYLNWAGKSEGMSLDIWGGKTITIGATIRYDAPFLYAGPSARRISVSTDIGGVRSWSYAESVQGGSEPGEYRLTVTFTLPAGGVNDFWFARLLNGSDQIPVWWDGLTVEEGTTDGSYFDPSYSPDPDMRARNVGGTVFSECVLEVENIGGALGAVGVVAAVSSHNGMPAMRLFANSGDLNSSISVAIATPIRDGGTFLAGLAIDELMPGSNTNARRLNVTGPWQRSSPQASTDPGVTYHRLEYEALTSAYQARFYHGGILGDPSVKWFAVGLFEPEYQGPVFSGDSGTVVWGDTVLVTTWDGERNNSPSRATMAPETVAIDVERSIDGGLSWVTLFQGVDPGEAFTDRESLSKGVTLYRVTSYAATGAATSVVHEVVSDSGSLHISAGPGFIINCRLPFNPEVGMESSRERATEWYDGRELPVAYSGEAVTNVYNASGWLLGGQVEESATWQELQRLALVRSPVFMVRDPEGTRMYGVISPVSLPRKNGLGWRGYSFTLTETDH